jgi:DNA-binding NtrC family response regulator
VRELENVIERIALLTEKEEANFSLVNFNALPAAYVPPRFSILRVLVPLGAVIGIGLIVFLGILILHNRAEMASLSPQVIIAETTVTKLQRDTATLKTQIGLVGATADELNARLNIIEGRGRAFI